MTKTPESPLAAEPADGFLARWSRRKSTQRQGLAVAPEPPAVAPTVLANTAPIPQFVDVAPANPADSAPAAAVEPPPTLDDVAALLPGDDVRRFVVPGGDATVRNAALKKLFADPHYNLMDGLDTYIDDYGRPDPLPVGMLRQMAQSQFLGLFNDEDNALAPAPADRLADTAQSLEVLDAPSPTVALAQTPVSVLPATHENADLRLQPLDAPEPGGVAPGAGPDPGR